MGKQKNENVLEMHLIYKILIMLCKEFRSNYAASLEKGRLYDETIKYGYLPATHAYMYEAAKSWSCNH